MKVLINKATKDSDLKKGLRVSYADAFGTFTLTGAIERVYFDGIWLYIVNGAAYSASELKLIAPEPPNIKESNYWCIYDFAMNRSRPEMQGNKLKALFKLIEKRGEPIKTKEESLKGLKALQIRQGEWVAIKRTAMCANFYPCQLKTYLLTQL